jgi:hypothetical protein
VPEYTVLTVLAVVAVVVAELVYFKTGIFSTGCRSRSSLRSRSW